MKQESQILEEYQSLQRILGQLSADTAAAARSTKSISLCGSYRLDHHQRKTYEDLVDMLADNFDFSSRRSAKNTHDEPYCTWKFHENTQ